MGTSDLLKAAVDSATTKHPVLTEYSLCLCTLIFPLIYKAPYYSPNKTLQAIISLSHNDNSNDDDRDLKSLSLCCDL